MNNKIIDQVTPQVGSPMEDSTEYIEQLQKEFGLLSDRITLGRKQTLLFYGVITGYLRNKFGINSEQIRNKFGTNAINILMLITIDPSISANDIGEIMGVTSRTIENYLSKLKDDKVIEREGSRKSGLWKIIEQK
jgi:ATP-dependent DNA helicase RecG